MPSANRRTYFKRELPAPAVAFSCAEGRAIFAEALAAGTMVGFFRLIEQFTTQEEPQYCGLAALVVALNALGIDPRRTWKGAWRWWAETMLDCCKSLEDIRRDGITMGQVACLARCNGADVSVHRHGAFDPAAFRRLLAEVCAAEDRVLVASYSRQVFRQSGDGHFSPLGGYCPGRDMVLILDVARFKYSPHWVRVDDLLEAMAQPDPAIGKPRGFLLLGCRTPRESALFMLDPAVAPLPRQLPPAALRSALRPAAPAVAAAAAAAAVAAPQAVASAPLAPPALAGGSSGDLGPAAAALSSSSGGGGGGGGWGCGLLGMGMDKAGSCSSLSSLGGCSINGGGGASPRPGGGGGSADVDADAAAAAAAAEVAEAYAFITRQAPALLRQQLGLAPPPPAATATATGQVSASGEGATAAAAAAGGGAEAGDEDHDLEEEDEEEAAATAAAGGSSSSSSGSSSGGVPTLEALVAALVAAAPLRSICTLLVRRPTLAAVGEAVPGPCCGCPIAAAAAAAAAAAGPQEAAAGAREAPVPAPQAVVAGAGVGGARDQQACCSGGGGGGGGGAVVGGISIVTAVAPSPFLPLAGTRAAPHTDAHAHAHTHSHTHQHDSSHGSSSSIGSSCCKAVSSSSSSSGSTTTTSSTASEGLASADGNGSSASGASGSSNSGSSMAGDDGASPDPPLGLYGRNSVGATFVGGGSSSSNGDGSSMLMMAGATAGGDGSSRCCHGEPLEHHCVPPQVQALTLEELRFTNMFKLVSYCLRRAAGCSHAPPPDLSAFMKPAMPAAAAAPAAVAAQPAVAAAAAASPVGQGASATATASATAISAAAPAAPAAAAAATAGGECGCSLHLPDMAAEKLTAALLLLSEADCWPVQQPPPPPPPPSQPGAGGANGDGCSEGSSAATAAAAAAAAAAAGVRMCKRPNCRRCRRRLAAAGDRAAALAVLREEWGSLLRLAPLGLFASSPVLRDELAFVRLQLAASPLLAGSRLAAPAAPAERFVSSAVAVV